MITYEEMKEGERGAWISMIAYICLSILKITVGTSANSEALMADGLNNMTDIFATTAVLIGLRISRKPPDGNHRYGHFRAETIAALLASLIMIAVGIQVLVSAAGTFFADTVVTPDMPAAWTAIACAGVMLFVFVYNTRLSKKLNSTALSALAKDNLSDALVSIGAFVGIIGSLLGYPLLDPLAAAIVGLIICKTAWGIFKDASHSLSDGFDERQLRVFKETVQSVPGVLTVKDIRARTHGNQTLVDITIGVHGHLNVMQSHDISEEIENLFLETHRIGHVHIHIEPIASPSL